MDTPPKPEHSTRNEVIEYSRTMYSHPRAEVEAAIVAWRTPIEPPRPAAPFPSQSFGRPPRKDNPSRQQNQPRALLDVLKQGSVDFKGRTIEPEKPPHATNISVPADSNQDLKSLIEKALGKK